MPVENGRVQDTAGCELKSALREIFERYDFPARITAQQNLLIADVPPSAQAEIEAVFARRGVRLAGQLPPVRRQSFACPALPTCGLALTESERALPGVIRQLVAVLVELSLSDLELDVRMTGCPNGCARPYNAEIGLVGSMHHPKTGQGKYTIFLGGSRLGNRLNESFREKVFRDDLVNELRPVLERYVGERLPGEGFGDWCHRIGVANLRGEAGTVVDERVGAAV